MKYLRDQKLDQVIKALKQPVLGICLGMQLLCKHSEENNTECLGIFDEEVKRFTPAADKKVPHMGWNQLTQVNGWIDNKLTNQNVYFVHSYYVPVNKFTSAVTQYAVPFSAAMKKDNFYAVQFHPEKSAEAGQTILKNFLQV
jgi:glutamine amidotransferase